MKKYFVLYMAPLEELKKMMANSTPEQQKAGMDEWMKWAEKYKANIVDLGMPLGKTKRVNSGGTSDVTTDIGGYSIVQAESHEAAAKLFEGHGHLQVPGAWIDILEIMPMPGMDH
jgi:hypothetical protein